VSEAPKPFKDHFSEIAAHYAAFRPVYPEALAEYLATISPARNLAWDAGCGSGQLSLLLANKFEKIIATDASAEQLQQARPHPHVTYRLARAEDSGIEAGTVDLCTAAQAVHWFDIRGYYAEIQRVAKKGAIVALICYPLTEVEEPIGGILRRFYGGTLGPYWPPERRDIENGYSTLPFPFEELKAPDIAMEAEWNFTQFAGYIETWSAVRALKKSPYASDWPAFLEEAAKAWGDLAKKRPMRWPSFMRIGRVI
jgi:SAM-dependent methyltransferase